MSTRAAGSAGAATARGFIVRAVRCHLQVAFQLLLCGFQIGLDFFQFGDFAFQLNALLCEFLAMQIPYISALSAMNILHLLKEARV